MAAALLVVAGWAGRAAIGRPWGLGLVAVAIHSVVDFPMQERALALWAFTLMGAMLADARVERPPGATCASGGSPALTPIPVQNV